MDSSLDTEQAETESEQDALIVTAFGDDEVSNAVQKKPSQNLADLRTQALTLPSEQLKGALIDYQDRRQTFAEWLLYQMEEGVHYGSPPGCRQSDSKDWKARPSLYKAGADLVTDLMGVRATYKADADMWAQLGSKAGTFVVKCLLISKANEEIVGEGGGAFKVGEKKMQENAALKMAQKRCLGATTKVLCKTSSGVSVMKLDGLYRLLRKENREPLRVLGINGEWRTVMGAVKSERDRIEVISLRDGSHINATMEHRFPTTEGLKHVSDLSVGMKLLRSKGLPVIRDDVAMKNVGYCVGAFIADGCFTSKAVRFTLGPTKLEVITKIREVAFKLGCRVSVRQRNGSKAIDVVVTGSAFYGLMNQYVAGRKSSGKHFSQYVWEQGKIFIEEVLDGYLDCDGSRNERDGRSEGWIIGFHGDNESLAEDLRVASAILGWRACVRRGQSRLNDRVFAVWTGWIKKQSSGHGNECCLEEITEIKTVNRRSVVYDIEVDGDHLFCLWNGIQTHNSKVDAVLNAWGLADLFTQDLEDPDWLPEEYANPKAGSSPTVQSRGDGVTSAEGSDLFKAWQKFQSDDNGKVSQFREWAGVVLKTELNLADIHNWTQAMLTTCYDKLGEYNNERS